MNKKKKLIILLILLIILLAFIPIWAFFIEPNLLIVRHLTIEDSELSGIRVAYLCDLHICQDGKNFALKIIEKVNEQNPDIILLGGDYVVAVMYKNKSMKPQNIAELLMGLKAKFGVFMVFGNHELHFNAWKKFSKILNNSNIKILQNSSINLKINDKSLWLVGIDDYSNKKHDIDKAFKNVEKPVIAFTHSPDIFPKIPNYVNFTFAGHSHGGQVYIPGYGPLGKPTNLSGKYIKGFYKEDNKKMFVSSGIGTSHLKVRFLNLPEIVIADFK